MVSLAQIIGGILTTELIACLWVWRETRNIRNDYNDDFDEMMVYRASQFRSELHAIVMDVLDDIEYKDLQASEEPDAIVWQAMEGLNRDSLTEVEVAMRNYDEPSELITRAEGKYWSAIKNCGISLLIGVVVIAITIGVSGSDARAGGQIFVGLIWLLFSIEAIQDWKSGFEAERQVDQFIRDYQEY